MKKIDRLTVNASLQKECGRGRPRLFICPTGVFTHIPLHAAGIYSSTSSESCADYCVISYTPTLTALLESGRDHHPILKEEERVLLVAVSRPFEGATLESVMDEADVVSRIVPSRNLIGLGTDVQSTAGQNNDATVGRVIQQLPEASILHMSCHGLQDMEDPLESGFLMRDRKLTVAQLMNLNLPSAFFAFLGACDTAKGDAKQPDQVIHLAATMLYAGFKTVVGTMW